SNYLADKVDKRYLPPKVIKTNMQSGLNGVREGRGFFDYSSLDTAAYRHKKLREFVDLLGHRGLLPVFNFASTHRS
ncbi:MAG: hypothetical protein VW757_10695, partial [Halieaceae bacterium]